MRHCVSFHTNKTKDISKSNLCCKNDHPFSRIRLCYKRICNIRIG
ncbi:hypothetical protein ES288_A13G090300v1 [Gossypium darwinii]|uniref:Uncharacterized protein n=1 Tax=Gossypium darwinii TaxID=34276 RepID=A0A5D2DXW6_GOSDA|nr:hypothetical protein ES288_A13G090300v1 [Gossypium darwinii]